MVFSKVLFTTHCRQRNHCSGSVIGRIFYMTENKTLSEEVTFLLFKKSDVCFYDLVKN